MKIRTYSFIFSFLTALILPSSIHAMHTSHHREEQTCMAPRLDKQRIIYESNIYGDYLLKELQIFVNEDIQSIKSTERLNETKAKGILGEEKARKEVEDGYINVYPFDQSNYVSIFTLFEKLGCEITSVFRNASDNGLDDIFVRINERGRIPTHSYPIFHESKYQAKGGHPHLTKNAISCDQLSSNWIDGHLTIAHNKAYTLASICFPSQTTVEMTLPSCNPCYTKIKDRVEWLNHQFDQGAFYKTASVLDRYGNITFYLAEKETDNTDLAYPIEQMSQLSVYGSSLNKFSLKRQQIF